MKIPNDRRSKWHCILDSKEIFQDNGQNESDKLNNSKKRTATNRLSTVIDKPSAPATRRNNKSKERNSSVESNGSVREPVHFNYYPNTRGQSSKDNNQNNNFNNINNNNNDNNESNQIINNNNNNNESNQNNNNNNNNNNNEPSDNSNNNAYKLDIELEPEYSLSELLSLAKSGIFPKKSFIVENRLKKKTQISHFFTSIRTFTTKPRINVEFICKEQGCKLHEPFGDLSNLNKHFTNKPNDHPIMAKWYELYKKTNKASQDKILPDSTFNLIKFFIASDTALEQLNSNYLRNILLKEIKMYSVYTFRYKILPAIMKTLNETMEKKLNSSEFITLITDGWTGPFSNTEYIAVCAQTITESWDTDFMVLGMVQLKKGHSAEEVQAAIELIMSKFKIIDQNKIVAVITDGGKNNLKLFHPLLNESDISLYDNEIEEIFEILAENQYDPNLEEENQEVYLDNNYDDEEGTNTVDIEINDNIESINNTQFQNLVKLSNEQTLDSNESFDTNFDFTSMYETMPTIFKINFGTADLPLFNCSNHKLNLATRAAISIHHELTEIIKDLNKINASIRQTFSSIKQCF